MKGEWKNWRIGELEKRCRARFSSIPQFLSSSVLLLLLGACGFQPMHSQSYREQLSVDLSALIIEVEGSRTDSQHVSNVGRRYSELLEAEITDQVNPGGVRSAKQFKLAISYNEQQVGLFVNPDGTASRGDIIYTSNYTITRLSDQMTVASGSLNRTSSYSTSPTADYASYVSIEDARKRGILELAQDYKLRLAALVPTLNNPTRIAVEKPQENIPILQPNRSPNEALPPGY